MRILSGIEDIAIRRLDESDVVRHKIVRSIIKAYEADELAQEKKPERKTEKRFEKKTTTQANKRKGK